MVLTVGAVLSLIGVTAAGRLQLDDLVLGAVLGLPMIALHVLGSRYASRVDHALLRRVVLVASLAGGCVVLAQALT